MRSMRRTTRGNSRSASSGADSVRQSTSCRVPAASSSASPPRRQARTPSSAASKACPARKSSSFDSRTVRRQAGGNESHTRCGESVAATRTRPPEATAASGLPSSRKLPAAIRRTETGLEGPASAKSEGAARTRASSTPGSGRPAVPRTHGPDSAETASATKVSASAGSAASSPTRPTDAPPSGSGAGPSTAGRSASRSSG
jgi:hypothetical protein